MGVQGERYKRKIISEDFRVLYYDSLVCYDIDALLEELERSSLQDSGEYSNPDPLPKDQYSGKESAETSDIPSVQDDTSPLQVTFHLLECLEYRCLSVFWI